MGLGCLSNMFFPMPTMPRKVQHYGKCVGWMCADPVGRKKMVWVVPLCSQVQMVWKFNWYGKKKHKLKSFRDEIEERRTDVIDSGGNNQIWKSLVNLVQVPRRLGKGLVNIFKKWGSPKNLKTMADGEDEISFVLRFTYYITPRSFGPRKGDTTKAWCFEVMFKACIKANKVFKPIIPPIYCDICIGGRIAYGLQYGCGPPKGGLMGQAWLSLAIGLDFWIAYIEFGRLEVGVQVGIERKEEQRIWVHSTDVSKENSQRAGQNGGFVTFPAGCWVYVKFWGSITIATVRAKLLGTYWDVIALLTLDLLCMWFDFKSAKTGGWKYYGGFPMEIFSGIMR